MMRLVLDEQAFRDLVAGRVAKPLNHRIEPVEIILSDIGWDRMLKAINDAMQEELAQRMPGQMG